MLAGRGEDDAGHAGVRNPQGFPPEPHHSRIIYPYCVHLALSNSDSFALRSWRPEISPAFVRRLVGRGGEGEWGKGRVRGCHGRRPKWTARFIQGFQVGLTLLLCCFWFDLFSTVHLGNWDFELCQHYGNYLIIWSCRLLIQAVKHDRSYCIAVYLDK